MGCWRGWWARLSCSSRGGSKHGRRVGLPERQCTRQQHRCGVYAPAASECISGCSCCYQRWWHWCEPGQWHRLAGCASHRELGLLSACVTAAQPGHVEGAGPGAGGPCSMPGPASPGEHQWWHRHARGWWCSASRRAVASCVTAAVTAAAAVVSCCAHGHQLEDRAAVRASPGCCKQWPGPARGRLCICGRLCSQPPAQSDPAVTAGQRGRLVLQLPATCTAAACTPDLGLPHRCMQ